MLKCLLFQFRVGYHQTIAHEVSRVTVTFRRAEPVEIGLLFLDHAVGHWIDTEPRGDRKPILVRPGLNRR